MAITKKELECEIYALQEFFGLTSEEVEGYLEFYEESFKIEELGHKKIETINGKRLN